MNHSLLLDKRGITNTVFHRNLGLPIIHFECFSSLRRFFYNELTDRFIARNKARLEGLWSYVFALGISKNVELDLTSLRIISLPLRQRQFRRNGTHIRIEPRPYIKRPDHTSQRVE